MDLFNMVGFLLLLFFVFFNSDGVAFKGFEISKKLFFPFQMDFFVTVQSHRVGVPIVLLAGLEMQS